LILTWFRGLGLTLREPEALLSQCTLKEFSDGVLLCKLVQILERFHGRCATFGSCSSSVSSSLGNELVVEERATSRAQKVQNIRRALDTVASHNPRISLSTLLSRDTEKAILEGDATVIMRLLGDIRKAYQIGAGTGSLS
jgi:hypothetical protein